MYVRRKTKHALHEGVAVTEYLEADNQLESAMERVGEAWLSRRRGPQIHISHIRLFADRYGKRWFYAQQAGRVVGVVVLNQLQMRQGWLMNHLMLARSPHPERDPALDERPYVHFHSTSVSES